MEGSLLRWRPKESKQRLEDIHRMATRKIVTKEDLILKMKSRPVKKFNEHLGQLLDDMAETMYADNGVGLAAVQVAVLRRAIVVDVGDGLIELINPEILKQSGRQTEMEGCLSLPGEYYETIRPAKMTVKAQDRYGDWHTYQVEGFKAQCFSHEIDHLDGILFTQRLNPNPKSQEEWEEIYRMRRAEKAAKEQDLSDIKVVRRNTEDANV